MAARELLAELGRRGVELAAAGERLRYRPRGAVPAELRAAMAEHRAELLHLLADGDYRVRWRAEAMRPKVPRTGSIPFLVARDAPPSAGACLSCGERLAPCRRYRCGPCEKANRLVLAEVREGVRGADPGRGSEDAP